MCDTSPPPQLAVTRGSRPGSRQASRTSVKGGGGGAACPSHPRPDCCRIPCSKPPLPKCPLGIYVERTQPIKPDRYYEAPTFPFDGLSTYREHYFLKCGEPSQSYKPQSLFDPSDAKLDGLSTYREAYVPRCPTPYKKPAWAKLAQFDPSSAKFDGISTYRKDYNGCATERVRSMKPDSQFDPSSAKMEGASTYRMSYIPYCPREYAYAKLPLSKKDVVPSFSCAPMEGATTYRMDFFPKCGAKRRSMKPSIAQGFSTAKVDGVTTYRNDYFPFHFQRCPEGPCIPAQMYDQVYPACGMMACQGDPETKVESDPWGGCCGGPVRVPGTCGDAQGLFPGQPLPPCCQPDEPPPGEGDGDC